MLRIPQEEFDPQKCLLGGQVFRFESLAPGEWRGADGANSFWLTMRQEGGDWIVEGEGSEAAFARLLRLEVSFREATDRVVRREPRLGPWAEATRGLRLMRSSCPVEAALGFLCTSCNHVKRIGVMVQRLAERGPLLPPMRGWQARQFPELEAVAAIPEAELRGEGFGYRAATLPLAAQAMVDRGGRAWLAGLAQESSEDIRAELIQLPGVGPKLADCIALFALNRLDSVPVDTHVWSAAVELYFPEWRGLAPSPARMAQVSARVRDEFGEDAAWAQQLMFSSGMLRGRRRIEK